METKSFMARQAVPKHTRKSIRMPKYDYVSPGDYFITICTQNRANVFGNIANGAMVLNEWGMIAEKCWRGITEHYPNTSLHEFVIMPDHIHGIMEIEPCAETIGDGISGDEKSVSGDGKSVGANNYSPLQIPPSPPVSTPFRPTGTSWNIGAIVRGFKIGVTKQIGYSICQRRGIIRECGNMHHGNQTMRRKNRGRDIRGRKIGIRGRKIGRGE
jgi:hypothetical protein